MDDRLERIRKGAKDFYVAAQRFVAIWGVDGWMMIRRTRRGFDVNTHATAADLTSDGYLNRPETGFGTTT